MVHPCGVCCQIAGEDCDCAYLDRCEEHREWEHCWHGQHLRPAVFLPTEQEARGYADVTPGRPICFDCAGERLDDLRAWAWKEYARYPWLQRVDWSEGMLMARQAEAALA